MSEPTGPRWFFANLVQVKLSQAASGGVMSMIELVGPSGDMPPLHVHWTDDEAWFVLEGEMSFHVGDEQPIRVSAGELAFGPRGVPHTYRVESATPARSAGSLAATTNRSKSPGVQTASHRAELPPPHDPPSEDEVAAVTALAAECQIELLGPPGTLPA